MKVLIVVAITLLGLVSAPPSEARENLCRFTTYCIHCDPDAHGDASKYRVNETCAASTNIPRYSLVWIEGVGEREVTDRGGAVRVHKGMTADFDLFVLDCQGPQKRQHDRCWNGSGTHTSRHWRYIRIGRPRKTRKN